MHLRPVVTVILSQALLTGIVAGCQAPPKTAPPPPPPVSWSDVARVQSDLQQRDRGARAGSVVRVRKTEQLAAVQLVPTGGAAGELIKLDDLFTITDSTQKPVASGAVVNIDGDFIVISYAPASGGRVPNEGDMAIHLSAGR